MMLHRLTERITVSGALTADDFPRLAAEGFRSLVDLRSDGEPRPQGVAPWDEATLARQAGLAYRQVPVEPQLLGEHLAHSVRQAVDHAAAPVLLHCTTGRRAGTFGLILLACQEDLSVDDCLARGRKMGLDFDGMPRLTTFLRTFVERHGRRYRSGADDGDPDPRELPSIRRRTGSG